MGLIFNWFDKISRYYKFTAKELRGIIISTLVIAFAISFNKWGHEEVDIALGFTNLIGAILIVGLSFVGRQLFQKIWALGADFQAEYRMWSFGLLITLAFAFITKGWLWFLIPGGIIIHYMPGNRLGWVRYGLNHFGIGVVSLAGPLANILLAMIFKTLYQITSIQLFHTAFILNIIWAVWTMLPIPPADGVRALFGSRMVYMFGLAIVVSSAILLYSSIPIYITIPLSFIIAWIWWLIYYIVWERFNWKGPY